MKGNPVDDPLNALDAIRSELKTLAEWGISAMALTYDDGTAFDDESNDVTVFGNTLHGLASFTMNGQVVVGTLNNKEMKICLN